MPTGSAEFGHVRWKRFAIAMVPSTIVAALMVFATANGVLAASFAVSEQIFKVSATSLDGTGFVQFGGIDHTKNGRAIPVIISGFRHATIVDLCQSVRVGPFVIRATSGTRDDPATATDLVIDLTSLSDEASFTNLELGRDASTLTGGPPGVLGPAGLFGQQATTVRITNFKQNTAATTAGVFTFPGLSLGFGRECF
jgi:Family of unknown function (DUF6230)